MTVFVKYIYNQGLVRDRKRELIAIPAEDLSIHVPKDAFGFCFISAETIEQAQENKGPFNNYLLGTFDQVMSKDRLERSKGDVAEVLLKKLALLNKEYGVERLFFLNETLHMGMFSHDKVLDPETREIVYPREPKILKLKFDK